MKTLNKQKAVNTNSGVISERFSSAITEMENEILANLSDLEKGYGKRKWSIAEQTGIPEDILTVLLKRLKLAGKVKLIMIWDEATGLPNGSGYCLQSVIKSVCYNCGKQYNSVDLEHGMCHKCWEPIKETN